MNLPKLYAPVLIEFSSFTIYMGEEIDTLVRFKCRRVLIKDGWKWQIINLNKITETHDIYADAHQDTLDMIGEDISEIKVLE